MGKMPAQQPGTSKQNYQTPVRFVDAVKRRFGIAEFAVDFAADHVNALSDTYFDEHTDALSVDGWADWCRYNRLPTLPKDQPWGWLNPPFSKIGPWAAKCRETALSGGQVLLLVPAAVGSNWYRDHVDGKARVLFLNGRLCFIDDWAETVDPASFKKYGEWRNYSSPPLYPKDCMLCVYSPVVTPGTEVWTWGKK
jgi:phage N-6-adenine-methyltransferase